jgi:hypothetical protein
LYIWHCNPPGEKAAEQVLSWVYDTFKGYPGCGTPPYSEKITDLIYVTQGNSYVKAVKETLI